MDLQDIAKALANRVAGKPAIGGTLELNLGTAGSIFIDGSGNGNAVSTNGASAGCTISISAEDFAEVIAGRLQPTSAYMQGKMQIDGDMGLAMKLSQLV